MIGLDFETYGSRDLTKVGLQNYVNDPLFQPLVAVAYSRAGVATVFDFITDGHDSTVRRLNEFLLNATEIAAHNAGFEKAVLDRIGIHIPASKFLDTAVVAAYHGAGRSLEAAAEQLLNVPKYARGKELIKTFCIPGVYQVGEETLAFNPKIRKDLEGDWDELITYCAIDAALSFQLSELPIPVREHEYSVLTMRMNQRGWPVDMELVEEMDRRYHDNLIEVEEEFITKTGEMNLNLFSTSQMIKWCAERGVRATSFDEENVEKMLTTMLNRLGSTTLSDEKREQYGQVRDLLFAKQDIGGSSLKKLEVLNRQVAEDSRLYDSYMHFGAQATGRTTGRGVQMQNLPRLYGEGDDVDILTNPLANVVWSNRTLSRNLRQVFCASNPLGKLVVGDFSSVESRGLAWQAEEQWKINAYAQGQDLYKVLASRIYDVDYDSVTKTQRQVGKTGELSCGYGAGPGAVHAFAKGMGVEMTEAEAASLVKDWRAANPKIVEWWQQLQDALLEAVVIGSSTIHKSWGYVRIDKIDAPGSLRAMGPKDSLDVLLVANDGTSFKRYIHGVEQQGRNLTYYKPSERKTGDLWSNSFTDPKTKQTRQFTVYGGKLAGLLTQSLCRELFFQSVKSLESALFTTPNAKIIGQFHDEIVVEWEPGDIGLNSLITKMEAVMSTTTLPGFPLAAEIKSAYRYIK